VDAICQGTKIGIYSADNDAGMTWLCIVEVYEVFAVKGEERPVLRSGVFQNLFVWNFAIGSARIVRGQDIVTQVAERFYSGTRKIFVLYRRAND
jgi:hypothetical protein